jgi:PTS system nitrogen regulatory IIA component
MRLSVQDAARSLNVSTKTIYRWLAEGRIPGYRVNKQYRFDRAELLEWANAQRLAVPSQVEHTPEHPAEPLPRFDEALEDGGIHYRLGGTTRDEVLRSAVPTLRLVDEPDRDVLIQALLAREELAPTTVGEGFALPHLRNPLRLEIRKPTISLCYLDHPVDWGGPDGVPVTTLFLVVGPTVRSILRLHIESLFALRDPAFRDVVREHRPREVILTEARRVAAGLRRPADPNAR